MIIADMTLQKKQSKQTTVVLLIAGALSWQIGRCETVELKSVADTTLIQTAPNNNHGATTFFNAGTTGMGTLNRGLIRFDLAGVIPTDAVIQSAYLNLTVVFVPAAQLELALFGIHRVLAPWGEGDKVPESANSPGLGAPATGHEATWNNRFHDTQESWSVPGGQSGVDFVSNASSVEFIETEGTYRFDTTPRLNNDVQGWVANPQSNFGWMLVTFSEDVRYTARRFGSREDPDYAPTLTVTYQVVPEPGTVGLFVLGLGGLVYLQRHRMRRAQIQSRARMSTGSN